MVSSRRRHRLSSLLFAVATVASLPAVYAAEPSEAERDAAAQMVFLGDEKRKAGDHEAALNAYAQADGIMGVPTTGIEVARELIALGRFVEARKRLRQIVKHGKRDGEPDAFQKARTEAQSLLEVVKTNLAYVRIWPYGAPSGTTVRVEIDGKDMPDVDKFVAVDPGEHVVSVRAADSRPTMARIGLNAGDKKRVEFDLTDGTPVYRAAAPGDLAHWGAGGSGNDMDEGAPGADAVGPPERESVPMMVSGIVLATLGGSAALGGAIQLGLSSGDAADEGCSLGSCPAPLDDYLAAGVGLTVGGIVTTVVGVVVAAIGARGEDASAGKQGAQSVFVLTGPARSGLAWNW